MLATATLQHNLAAVQSQLQRLQLENSALTRDLCLKENYIQLKDQQFRVMQRRLEELEGTVALWKDRCLQQLNNSNVSDRNSNNCKGTAESTTEMEESHALTPTAATVALNADKDEKRGGWTPWAYKPSVAGANSRAKAVAQASAKLERLSQTDRDKLQPLLSAIEKAGSAEASIEMGDVVFSDVSEELSKILLLHLLPTLLDVAGDGVLQCFSRTYAKQTMDFRVCRPQNVDSSMTSATAENKTSTSATPAPAVAVATPSATVIREGGGESLQPPPYMRTLSAAVTSSSPRGSGLGCISEDIDGESLASFLPATDAESATEEEAEPPHLFDCVECERRGSTRAPVPHGPRELHPTKAMYVSHPLSGSAAARASVPLMDKPPEGKPEKTSRRYTLTPKRNTPTFAVENARTFTMGAMPSPSQSPSGVGATLLGSDGDAMPQPSREKDGKIKKIVGSVFDRLSRHKPQLPMPSSSSSTSNSTNPPSHASPLMLGGGSGAGEVAADDDSMCDGCGRGPLVGSKWVCRTCRLLDGQEFELCDKCYGQGLHGKEHEDALFARVEAIVVRKCPKLLGETELLRLLRGGICKANLKKFSFCLTWIADLLQCTRTTDLRARALEIAHIPSPVRSEFARLLRELLARYRPDIELTTEWEPTAGAQQGSHAADGSVRRAAGSALGDVGLLQLDTLRIWVKDAPTVAATASSSSSTPA